jgi:glycosyltransferase involved in cell wall biosynthesis
MELADEEPVNSQDLNSDKRALPPMFISVVLPAYNEEASIEAVIWDHFRALTSLQDVVRDWEIVCVDDASTDRTPEILMRVAAYSDRIKVVRHEENKGIYCSFADGFDAAHGTHIYATASDGQWPAENLRRLLTPALTGAELVVGVRTNRREIYTPGRQFVSFMFNLLPRIAFRVRTTDAGSVKLGVREVFTLDLVSHSPFAEAERIIRACRGGCKVEFVPILFNARNGGKESGAKWGNIFASVRDCLRCIRTYGFWPQLTLRGKEVNSRGRGGELAARSDRIPSQR